MTNADWLERLANKPNVLGPYILAPGDSTEATRFRSIAATLRAAEELAEAANVIGPEIANPELSAMFRAALAKLAETTRSEQ